MSDELPSRLSSLFVHGIDIDVPEYASMLNAAMKAHLKTTFTAQELEECGDNEQTAQRLAGRFATKETVLKALGLAFGDGVAFLDVETITADRKVSERASQLGVQSWLVSTSHTSIMAVAMDVAVCSGRHQPERLQKQTGRLTGSAAVRSGPEQPSVRQD